MNLPPPTSSGAVVRLLWKSARIRAAGRRRRQRELMQRKKGSDSNALEGFATLFMALVMAIVHGALAWGLVGTLETARNLDVDGRGRILISEFNEQAFDRIGETAENIAKLEHKAAEFPEMRGRIDTQIAELDSVRKERIDVFVRSVGRQRKSEMGGSNQENEVLIRKQLRQFGAAGFVSEKNLGTASLRNPHTIPAIFWPFAAFIFLWWMVMIVFQGEGLELDVQRRRHPMWEWLLAHPVRPVAAFAADMLSPLMANPIYFSAPVFWWIVLGTSHGVLGGFVGGIVVGLAFAVAASCMNKAMEISAMLRLSPRSRGAVLGLMSWLGYAAMMLPLFTIDAPLLKVFLVTHLGKLAAWIPVWPVRALVSGWSSEPVLWQAIVSGLVLAGLLLTASIALAWWGLRRGLQAGEGSSPARRPMTAEAGRSRFLTKNPLFHKELLWFLRDKGAVVQAILIPLTIASFQVFNLRGLLASAIGHWNGLCGIAVICGTYFLLVLGPRSLASEGAALWITMTWPRGMEDLLKAKARLWWMLSNVIAGSILLVAVYLFPGDWWRIALVGAGWLIFGRGLAEKTVTLVTAPSSSGEPEPPRRGQQWAALVGTLAFGSGVITGTWHTAMLGVVFSSLAAAAIWQNFRARLPYLYDPWSEKLPPAPSLMHAMIGIAVMVEVVGLASGISAGIGGANSLWIARAVSYGVVGFLAWVIMHGFLGGRGVKAQDVWRWEREGNRPETVVASGGAIFAGALLGSLALFYLAGLRWFPPTREWMEQIDQIAASQAIYKPALIALAVGMAPLAEEYFFRGLLYRALDREWGGVKAMVGSAAYFAMYHPPVSWLPVFALGMASAWIFKRSGSLIPCVLLHMTYNAVVVGWN